MNKTPQFDIGTRFKRYGKKHHNEYEVIDIYTTTNSCGEVIKIEYLTGHYFMGQILKELMVGATIARSLAKEA